MLPSNGSFSAAAVSYTIYFVDISYLQSTLLGQPLAQNGARKSKQNFVLHAASECSPWHCSHLRLGSERQTASDIVAAAAPCNTHGIKEMRLRCAFLLWLDTVYLFKNPLTLPSNPARFPPLPLPPDAAPPPAGLTIPCGKAHCARVYHKHQQHKGSPS